jgi:dTDP-4-amino-4,6-dideoxygalactose transaminase
MHYGGCSVGLEEIMSIAKEHDLIVIEDAAHGIDSYYNDKPLGGIGHMGVLSFHQSKNVSSGHGGLLIINDDTFLKRAEQVWNKGSNKSNFDNGEVDFYSWKTLGSSFFPSEIVAASLYGQLVHLEVVTSCRVKQWNHYYISLKDILNSNVLPLTEIGKGNGHIFYLKLSNSLECTRFISFLLSRNIVAASHYRCLHTSSNFGSSELLQHAERWVDCLVRLPLYHDLSMDDQDYIIAAVKEFFI